MNVVEAYIAQKGGLLIFLTGLPKSGKSIYSKELADDFKIKHIHIHNYYESNPDKKIEIKLSDETVVTNSFSSELINFDKLNKDIDNYYESGLVVSGFPFDITKLKYKFDFIFALDINQTIYLEAISKISNVDLKKEELIFQEVIKPYYKEMIEKYKVNRFFNVKKYDDKEKLYSDIFDETIKLIEQFLYKK